MEKKSLIVNTGSDSHKYALYEGGVLLAWMHLETEGENFIASIKLGNNAMEKRTIFAGDYALPVAFVLRQLHDHKIISDVSEISVVGVRIVAPGEYFISHNIINDEYLSRLKDVEAEAPIHISHIIAEVEEVKKSLPKAKIVGISDSAFHQGLPEVARRYAIPKEDCDNFGIYRFGYHGISVASVARKLSGWPGGIPPRVIVCHLGSGSSVTALLNGRSIDTSMGMTPLEGLPMGSRVGNIDASAVILLGQKKELDSAQLSEYLNTKCGFLAYSDLTKDVRELIELDRNGNADAKLALDTFAYSVRKYIGAYMAALGGLDLLVFTATIGERSYIMRERICGGLGRLGIDLDKKKNDETVSVDGYIHDESASAVKIAVVTTDEMGQIATEIQKY